LVDKAKARGFVIWIIYVVLDTAERNIERVHLRVAKGGHAVPEDKIRSRRQGSLAQFPWFLDQADQAWIYDNSGATPKRIGYKENGVVRLGEDSLPFVVEAVQKIDEP